MNWIPDPTAPDTRWICHPHGRTALRLVVERAADGHRWRVDLHRYGRWTDVVGALSPIALLDDAMLEAETEARRRALV
jgi:transposase